MKVTIFVIFFFAPTAYVSQRQNSREPSQQVARYTTRRQLQISYRRSVSQLRTARFLFARFLSTKRFSIQQFQRDIDALTLYLKKDLVAKKLTIPVQELQPPRISVEPLLL